MVVKLSDLSYVRIYRYEEDSNGDICIYAKDPSGNSYTVAFSMYPSNFYIKMLINGTEIWRISK